MASDIKDFLDQTKVDVAALGGGTAFNRVLIVPLVDIDVLMQNPRWPAALINDGGGELDPHNHKIWRRVLEITVVDSHQRDPWGEVSTREMLDLGETLVAGLEYNNTDSLFLEADSDIAAEFTRLGVMIVHKTYTFAYKLRRS